MAHSVPWISGSYHMSATPRSGVSLKLGVAGYRRQLLTSEQAAYWRAHPQVKQQMNTLLTVALALFVGNQIGKD